MWDLIGIGIIQANEEEDGRTPRPRRPALSDLCSAVNGCPVLTASRAAGAESPPDVSARRPAGPGQAAPVTDESGETGPVTSTGPDPAAPGSESPALSRRPRPGGPVGPHRGPPSLGPPSLGAILGIGDGSGTEPSIGDETGSPF